MGVYIEGMEMPAKGEYRMTLYVCDDGYAYMDVDLFPVDKDRFEAIPVPPHGRLIDADALDICRREQQAWQDYEHNPDNEYLEGVKDGLHEASKQLSTAMTIIKADMDVMYYPQVDGITPTVIKGEEEGNMSAFECEDIGAYYAYRDFEDRERNAKEKSKGKKKTNADRIRGKDDEKLADFIARQRFCAVNPVADKLGIDVTTAFIICRESVLTWLKQEAGT